jgi:hypothetical protein
MNRLVLAVPFLAVPLAAAACGGKSGTPSTSALPDDPAAAVNGAARKTAQSGSEHTELTGRVVASGQAITFTGGGDFDTKAHRGSMSVDLSLGGLNGTVEEVMDRTVVYVRSDLLAALLPGAGTKWVKLDLAKIATAQGLAISSLLAQDPAQSLGLLEKSSSDVTKVGEAQLHGAATTHYRARIDLSKVSGATSGTGRYDVWIGGDGYVHRVKAMVTSGGVTSSVTTDFSEFGEPVSVKIPAASNTFDGSNSTIPGLGG